ncbi:MAG TPA: PIN domain-containing protein [Vicinamibacteria bacterium]|nr:PIN domain-containing protein [Vicinamibacteria bacterium]
MSADRVFVDTNVLVYAHDTEAGYRHRRAADMIAELWGTRTGILSVQVLQEFYVNVTRKIPEPLPMATAREVVRNYTLWQTEWILPKDVTRASEIEQENSISFWDALIVTAAVKGGASRILSEDLNPGQIIAGIQIEDPFAVP